MAPVYKSVTFDNKFICLMKFITVKLIQRQATVLCLYTYVNSSYSQHTHHHNSSDSDMDNGPITTAWVAPTNKPQVTNPSPYLDKLRHGGLGRLVDDEEPQVPVLDQRRSTGLRSAAVGSHLAGKLGVQKSEIKKEEWSPERRKEKKSLSATEQGAGNNNKYI